ncbi:hypothetical protein GW17_00058719 [Ensete ventricosum]|nr:hypothetical protein GW17_00058719 [Ensete ventricosum]
MELQPDDWPRSSLGIRSGSNDAVGPHQEFTRRFAEGIGKLVGNMSGDRRKKTIGLAVIMSGATGLVGQLTQPGRRLNCPYLGILALSAVDSIRPAGEPPVP